MNTKGQSGTLTALFLSVVAVSAFTIFAVLYFGGGTSAYNINYNNTAFNQFDLHNQINNITLSTQQTLIGANSSTGASGGGIINTITTAGYQSFSVISNIPSLLLSMFGAVAVILGVPSQIVVLAFSMIVVMIISIIILLVFRVRI